MKMTDSFTISAPKENVWEVFMDVEKLAGCLPAWL
ncbi:SRPBCC domain-containing protein [Sporosarcina sp. P33]|nr:SRPBCC domain-containing protein [Sporosarcina sp. P33]